MEEMNIDPEFLARIESALDQIRPYLQADGGDVKVLEVTPAMVLKLEMVGACGTCPMSPMTLKAGVEQAILKAVPEIKAVEALNVMPLPVA
ncbi:NifU family protein [Adhaeribacter sp. BT258]|uniref:NifU family protein n=1 Tax=Adhaeribacter terrigena TaxID=2793070 RepID=A0ABS1BZB1_9BACT|nr:NifU family protein [Adhaeribacter terrigena]MBK0402261.1 NifU family protein [Adhaeribacter terrigena]